MQNYMINAANAWVRDLDASYGAHYRLGGYTDAEIMRTMWKYLHRGQNCRRAWARINMHMPETLTTGESLDILEFSTAHGAMLEIWRNHGHKVRGTDYAWAVEGSGAMHKGVRKTWHSDLLSQVKETAHENTRSEPVAGWPYQSIIESLDLEVDLFDGGALPYGYADKSFDVLCCYQAIEAYAHPDQWLDILAEFCRVTRKTIVLGFNPQPVQHADDESYIAEARKAWLAMQSYRSNGFACVFFEVGQTRRGVHPTAAKFQAI